jgi:hypothetical protein
MFAIVMFSSLEELQICSNHYSDISSMEYICHKHLKRLYISNNDLTRWSSICRLGRLFPLESFRSHDTNDCVQQCFAHLSTLSVDHVQISDWQDIIALTRIPCLNALRIHSAPLFKVRCFQCKTPVDNDISIYDCILVVQC